jgi:hypothetical protein
VMKRPAISRLAVETERTCISQFSQW